MMHLQLTTKLLAEINELPDAHPFAPLPHLTRSIQDVPGFAEVVVVVVHVLSHAVVDAELLWSELGQCGL